MPGVGVVFLILSDLETTASLVIVDLVFIKLSKYHNISIFYPAIPKKGGSCLTMSLF